ncbi:MAG: methyltransferase domain-containing protein [Candidatus Kapabacteria bacterium]|nr:methyltransferase domain-containing protein [Ignavibacteriota bacterium]MCW5885159.1 methyltransferase domain-containing protein [Candidatus Kapabacteria bacterium]
MSRKIRWEKAQNYEKNWWNKKKAAIDLSYLKKFADELRQQVAPFVDQSKSLKILEIGSGPAGILTHLNADLRCAVDPLEDFYSSVSEYADYRDKNVNYYKAMGEELPFDDSVFNLIIVDNVLDHCQSPYKVISEINRVAEIGAIIYFKQNTYHLIGKILRNILEKFEIDKGHPYNFTESDILKIFCQKDYEILNRKGRGHIKQLFVELKMRNLKALIRIFTLMTRNKITLILKKK